MKLRSRMDLNLLAVFDAIYSRASVTQAARHLHLSQSAISHALARLRREFDDALFVRCGNGLAPTALARSIAEPVRGALREIELAVAGASSFNPATTKRLFRIGLRPISEARVFGAMVARAMAGAPGVQLASVNFRRMDLNRSLSHGNLDLALDIPSEAITGLSTKPLERDSLVVAARKAHPLVRDTLNLETYLSLNHVVASPRPSAWGAEDTALAAIGEERRVTVRCQQLSAAWQIVAESDLLLTLPRSHAEMMRPFANMILVPLPIDTPPSTLEMYWHPTAEADPGHKWLRDIVIGTFAGFGHESSA